VSQDPTYEELLKHAASLEKRVKQLERMMADREKNAEKLKTKFLTNISQEIRTPMNAILGFSSLMNDSQLPGEKREEYMDHINQSSAKLLHLIEAIIDVSLMESGQLQIRQEECRINQLLSDIYHYFNVDRHRRARNSIALLLNLDSHGEEFTVITDYLRLHQVLTNLLNNAFKYTNKGIIEFGYNLDHDNKRIEFYISNSGDSTLRLQAELLFRSHERIDFNRDERIDSDVRLGLTLSKGIIKLLGGSIWIESNVFNGSTFKISIPYNRAKKDVGSKTIHPYTSKLFIA